MQIIFHKLLVGITCALALFFALLPYAHSHGILLGATTGVISRPIDQQTRLRVAIEVGLNSLRTDASWKFVETRKGMFHIPTAWDQFVDRANRRGIQVDLVLDYGNALYDHGDKPRSARAVAAFVRYASYVVMHFRGRVHYYEIWNEWNTHTGGTSPGSATDYAALFNEAYGALKRIDPTATFMVTSSSSDPGFERFYEALAKDGTLLRCDAVALHPYDFETANYRNVIGPRGPEVTIQRVIALEAMIRRFTGRRIIPIYITEIGWPANEGRFGFPEDDVAKMAARTLLMASALPYVKGIWWYNLRDSCDDVHNMQCRFGLTAQDLSLKPAAYAVRSVAPVVRRDHLAFDPISNLHTGLVVLDRMTVTERSRIAWYVGSGPQQSRGFDFHYAIQCDPELHVVRLTHRASNRVTLNISKPAEFTFEKVGCMRRQAFSLNSLYDSMQ